MRQLAEVERNELVGVDFVFSPVQSAQPRFSHSARFGKKRKFARAATALQGAVRCPLGARPDRRQSKGRLAVLALRRC